MKETNVSVAVANCAKSFFFDACATVAIVYSLRPGCVMFNAKLISDSLIGNIATAMGWQRSIYT